MDVTVTLNQAEVDAIVDGGSLPVTVRARVAQAVGESLDAGAGRLTCQRCGYARVTARTARNHLAMHVRADVGDPDGDVDVTDAMVADGFKATEA